MERSKGERVPHFNYSLELKDWSSPGDKQQQQQEEEGEGEEEE